MNKIKYYFSCFMYILFLLATVLGYWLYAFKDIIAYWKGG